MKTIIIGLVIILVFIVGIIGLDSWRSHTYKKQAKTIYVGFSKKEVEQTMGRPTHIFLPSEAAKTNFLAAVFNVRTETWAYGQSFQWHHPFFDKFPYFFPFRFRLFTPDKDDVSIEFNASNQVSLVTIPGEKP